MSLHHGLFTVPNTKTVKEKQFVNAGDLKLTGALKWTVKVLTNNHCAQWCVNGELCCIG